MHQPSFESSNEEETIQFPIPPNALVSLHADFARHPPANGYPSIPQMN
jgi:hypothetical protein